MLKLGDRGIDLVSHKVECHEEEDAGKQECTPWCFGVSSN